jgi:ABC-type oligopeptide transport system substrate-binding subunit
LAIDKERIVKKITRAGEKVAAHQVPPGVEEYESPAGLGHDSESARRLLAEAGYPNGRDFPRFQYLYNNQKSHEKIAVELQDMWDKTLGIRVDLRAVEWKVFLADQKQLNFDLSRAVGSRLQRPTPSSTCSWRQYNNGLAKNQQYDGWISARIQNSTGQNEPRFFSRPRHC